MVTEFYIYNCHYQTKEPNPHYESGIVEFLVQ